jgi:hypothetical protein
LGYEEFGVKEGSGLEDRENDCSNTAVKIYRKASKAI